VTHPAGLVAHLLLQRQLDNVEGPLLTVNIQVVVGAAVFELSNLEAPQQVGYRPRRFASPHLRLQVVAY
jgi:hypothetical protein